MGGTEDKVQAAVAETPASHTSPPQEATESSQPSIRSPLDIEETEVSLRAPRTKLRLGAILFALYVQPSLGFSLNASSNHYQLALFIAALDHTIVATAIPTISSALNSASGYFWIGSAYLLANAAAGPIWAKISDIWGRKPALLGAVAWFCVASIIAARSSDVEMLIAARALQGAAGGGIIQLVNITISDLFSMRQRTLFLGLVNVVWALAGGIGPLIGGAFAQTIGWRWICKYLSTLYCNLRLPLTKLYRYSLDQSSNLHPLLRPPPPLP